MAEEFKPEAGMSLASMLLQEIGKDESSSATESSQSTDSDEVNTDTTEQTPTDVAETTEDLATSEEPKAVPREIEFSFTDKNGVKQKSKFDLSDTEKLQQQLSLAAGARLWQAQRDQLSKQLKELETRHADISTKYSAVEQAWGDGGKDGLKGLVNWLTGDKEGFDKFLKSEVERVRVREAASPDELERMNLMEEREAAIREREKALKMLNQKEESAKKAQEEANHAATRAMIDPAFFEHSFDGKLGDPELEAELNEALWTSATKKLDALPEGTVLTPQLVKDTFAKVASKFSKAVTQQAEAKTKEISAKKKEQAQTKVAAAAKSGSAKAALDSKQIDEQLKTGGFASVFAKLMGN